MTASSTDNGHTTPGKTQREKLRKAELIELLLKQREEALLQLEEKDRRIAELSGELTRLKGEIDKEQSKQTIKNINQHVNQPTSKKPEWDKDGNPKPTTKGQKKKSNKKRKWKKRKGCGNVDKTNLTPDKTHVILLESMPWLR